MLLLGGEGRKEERERGIGRKEEVKKKKLTAFAISIAVVNQKYDKYFLIFCNQTQ